MGSVREQGLGRKRGCGGKGKERNYGKSGKSKKMTNETKLRALNRGQQEIGKKRDAKNRAMKGGHKKRYRLNNTEKEKNQKYTRLID